MAHSAQMSPTAAHRACHRACHRQIMASTRRVRAGPAAEGKHIRRLVCALCREVALKTSCPNYKIQAAPVLAFLMQIRLLVCGESARGPTCHWMRTTPGNTKPIGLQQGSIRRRVYGGSRLIKGLSSSLMDPTGQFANIQPRQTHNLIIQREAAVIKSVINQW